MDLRVILGNTAVPIPRKCRPRAHVPRPADVPPPTTHRPTLDALRAVPAPFTSSDWRAKAGGTAQYASARLILLTRWGWVERVRTGIRNTYAYRLTDAGRLVAGITEE